MKSLEKRCFNKHLGKRLLSFFMALIIFFGCLEMVIPTAQAAGTATENNPVIFRVVGEIDNSVTNGVKYGIIVSEVYTNTSQASQYQSFTITYPKSLTIDHTNVSSTWAVQTTTEGNISTSSFILSDSTSTVYASDLKTLINGIYFTLTTSGTYPDEGSSVGITASERKIAAYTDAAGYRHYYELIEAYTESSGVAYGMHTWLEAYNEAKTKTYYDPYSDTYLTGYLATITSQEEQAAVYNTIATDCGWLGGTRMVVNSTYDKIQDESSISEAIADYYTAGNSNSDTNVKQWYWACGPEATAGIDSSGNATGEPLVFYSHWRYADGDGTVNYTDSNGTTQTVYNAFNNPVTYGNAIEHDTRNVQSEPNNSYTSSTPYGEHCLQFAYQETGKGQTDLWNDYNYNYHKYMHGYYVEYGGYEGDPNSNDETDNTLSIATVELVMPLNVEYRSTVQDSSGAYTVISALGTGKDTETIGSTGGKYTVSPLDDNDIPDGYTYSRYVFTGDDTDKARISSDANGNVSGYYSTKQQTITFLYKPNSYTVTFDANGGDSVSMTTKTVTYDAEYGTLATAACKGYDFAGWYADSGGSGSEVTSDTIVKTAGDHTLYALWTERNSYTVKYDMNGADSTAEGDKNSVKWTDAGLLPSSEPSRAGYIFAGWNVSVGGSKQGVTSSDTYGDLADSDASGGSITLTAQWVDASKYTVIYNVNGADSPTSIADEVLTSDADTIPDKSVTRKGYVFDDWKVIDDGTGANTGTIVSYGDIFSAHAGASANYIILEAQWTAKSYTVEYNDNHTGGTGVIYTNSSVKWNDTGLLYTGTVSYNGSGYHVLTGWNTKADGSGATVYDNSAYSQLAGDDDTVSSVTLYAQWQEDKAEYEVRYDLNGSSSVQPSSKTVRLSETGLLPIIDASASDPSAPTPPTGYIFRGWDVVENGSTMNVTNSHSYQDLADSGAYYIVLQAQWSPVSDYKLVFDANNGAFSDGSTSTTEDDISWTDTYLPTLVDDPTYSGYTFTVWNTEADGSGTNVFDKTSYGDLYAIKGNNDSLTLYAQWVATEYRVIYDPNGATSSSLSDVTLSNVSDYVTFPGSTSLQKDGYTLTGWKVSVNGLTSIVNSLYDYRFTTTTYGDIAAMLNVSSHVAYIVLEAQWTSNDYTVIYDDNYSGTTSMIDKKTVTWDESHLIYSGTITRDGHKFLGWNTKSDGSGITPVSSNTYGELAGADTVTSVTLYAQWEAIDYTVKFAAGSNGSISGNISFTAKYGDTVGDVTASDFPEVTPDNGYKLIGWLCSVDGGIYDDTAVKSYPVTGNVTFTAQYDELAKATVVFIYDGGRDASGNAYTTVSGNEGDSYTEPANLTKEGYTYSSWDVSPEGTFGTAGSITYYTAQWTANTYTIEFDANDASATGSMSDLTMTYDTAANLTANAFTRTGYTFSGWNKAANGTGTFYHDEQEVLNLSSTSGDTITLYAQWTPNSYTVEYDTDGGGYIASISVKWDDDNLLPSAPTKNGYTFDGWYTKTDYTDVKILSSDSYSTLAARLGGNENTSSITLFAKWSAGDYTVEFDVGSGSITSGSALVTVSNGSTITSDKVPTVSAPSGYELVGWECSIGGGLYDTTKLENYVVTGNVTFTAQYAKITDATVIFVYDGGVDGSGGDYSIDSGTPGGTFTAPAPTKTGYTLSGWSGTPALTLVGADYEGTFDKAGSITTYTAQWAAGGHTVTYEVGSNGTTSDATSETVNHGASPVSVPSVTANTGYVFVGWECSIGNGLYDKTAVENYVVTADVTFTAKYADSAKSTVIFDYNGGTDGSAGYSMQSGLPGATFTAPKPTKNGSDFAGWSPALTLNGTDYEGIYGPVASSPVTYVAQWKATTSYTVKFYKGENGTISAPDTEIVDYGASVTTIPTVTANNGYTFIGWSKNSGTTYYSSKDLLTLPITEDTDFTASYTKTTTSGSSRGTTTTTYTVSYNSNDGTGSNRDTGLTSGASYTVNIPIGITYEGYTFTGWNTNADGSGTSYAPGEKITISENVVLYAQWEVIDLPTLNTDEHFAYISGYPDETVRPDNAITRGEAAQIFYNLLREHGAASGEGFSDVPGDAWYAKAVNYLAEIGVLSGYPDETFRPDAPITRAEFAAIAAKFDSLAYAGINVFGDVADSHWALSYINSAYVKGWVSGYPDGTFHPEDNITRAEVVTIVNHMLNRSIDDDTLSNVENPYKDITSRHWAYADIIEASFEHEYIRDDNGIEAWESWD